MFRQFARFPIRRCLHSRAGHSTRQSSLSIYALGISVTTAGYLAWSWSSKSRRISLDSETISTSGMQHTSPKPPRPSDTATPSAPQIDATEPSATSSEGEESPPAPLATPVGDGGAQDQGESSGGAFNPETGEINWDCPCLGGMAYGPCGQQFREAFSCFVYSEADPKGVDCVEKFKAMQNCFREHPEVYGDEIMDDDDDESLNESPTTKNMESDLQSSDSLRPKTTEQPLPSTSL